MNKSVFYYQPYQQPCYQYPFQRQSYSFKQIQRPLTYQPLNYAPQPIIMNPYQSYARQNPPIMNYSVLLSPSRNPLLSPQRSVPPKQVTQVSQAPPKKLEKIDLDDELQRRYQKAVDQSASMLATYQNKNENKDNQNQQKEEQLQQDQEEPQLEGTIFHPQLNKDLALQYEDGFIYRGQGIPPQTRQGNGILTDPQDRIVYDGNWNDNKYHGYGKLINFDEDEHDHDEQDWHDLGQIGNSWQQYEGEFFDGKMNGHGILTFKNGEIFEGQFNDGTITGDGTFKTIQSYSVVGIWENGHIKSYKKFNN